MFANKTQALQKGLRQGEFVTETYLFKNGNIFTPLLGRRNISKKEARQAEPKKCLEGRIFPFTDMNIIDQYGFQMCISSQQVSQADVRSCRTERLMNINSLKRDGGRIDFVVIFQR